MSKTKKSVFEMNNLLKTSLIRLLLSNENNTLVEKKLGIKYLLRVNGINFRLMKLFNILMCQNKVTRKEYDKMHNEFQKIIEKIEGWYDIIPRKYNFNTGIQMYGRGHSSIANCTKDFFFLFMGLKPILPEEFGSKFEKVADSMHCYPCEDDCDLMDLSNDGDIFADIKPSSDPLPWE